MNESDANRAMLDTARLRIDDPLEQTQRMHVFDRRRRQSEARTQMLEAAVADALHKFGHLLDSDFASIETRVIAANLSPLSSGDYAGHEKARGWFEHAYPLDTHRYYL